MARLPTEDGSAWIHPDDVQALYDNWPPDSDPPESCIVIAGLQRIPILLKAEKAHEALRQKAFANFIEDDPSQVPTGNEGIPGPGLPGTLDMAELDQVFSEGATSEAG